MKTISKIFLSLSLIASYGLNAVPPPPFQGITSSEIFLSIDTEVQMSALNTGFIPQTDYGALEAGECAVSIPGVFSVNSSLSNTYDIQVYNVDLASNMVLLNDDNTKSLEFQLAIGSSTADNKMQYLPQMVGIVNQGDYETAVLAGNTNTGVLVPSEGGPVVSAQATTYQYLTEFSAYFTYQQWIDSGIDSNVDDQDFTGTITWVYTSN